MNEPIPRLLAVLCGAFFMGTSLCAFVPAAVRTGMLLLFLLLLVLFLAFRLFPISRAVWVRPAWDRILVIAVMVLAILLYGVYERRDVTDPIRQWEGKQTVITGCVTEVRSVTTYAGTYVLRLEMADGEKANGTVILQTDFPSALHLRDRVTVSGTFRRFEESRNGYPLRRVEQSRGIVLRLEAEEGTLTLIGVAPSSLRFAFSELRSSLAAKARLLLGEENGVLLSALALGDRTRLPDAMKRNFRLLGVSHLLAISGLHLTILTAWIERILKKLLVPKGVRIGILSVFAILMLFLTGFPLSAVRTVCMLLIGYGAFFFARENDSLTALFVSAAAIVLVSPACAMDVGFQLSVWATFGVVGIAVPITLKRKEKAKSRRSEEKSRENAIRSPLLRFFYRRLKRLFRAVSGSLLVTFSVMLTTIPILWLFFGEMSLLSPLSNLILIPLVTVILCLAPLVFLLGSFPVPGLLLCDLTGLLLSLVRKLSETALSLPTLTISLRYPFTAAALVCAGLCAAFLLFARKKVEEKPGFRLLPLLAAVMVFLPCFLVYSKTAGREERALFLTMGTKEGFVCQSEGKTLLCDLSDGSYGLQSYGVSVTEEQFYACDLDAYCLTHYHNRHVSSFSHLASVTRIHTLYLPEPENESEAEVRDRLIQIASENRVEVKTISSEEEIPFGRLTLHLSERRVLSRSTHPTFCLTFSDGEHTVFYGSSSFAEAFSEKEVSEAVTHADCLIFGGHGPVPKQPLPDFLRSLVPSYTLMPDGTFCEIYGRGADELTSHDDEPHFFAVLPSRQD